ncbi:hypothetical protein EKO27_g6711 [Xylaria grammica]|uniref:SAP domain-containing protein n=1 Tax=Xylaria grammica TaxID=363999 RepID=A0A439D1Q8_9PEZI|nr:hypothetical protein EKO27_g6711 [Xylaria grammica]
MADYSRMKVVELKAELKRLGLPQNGLKAELVSRLEEAAAVSEDDTPAATSEPHAEPHAEPTTAVKPDEAQLPEDAEHTNDTQDLSRIEPTAAEPQTELAVPMAQNTAANDALAQTTSNTTVSETPSLPTTEVAQDVQKRKRRSTTPPPSEEVVRKRLRQDDSDAVQDTTPDPVSDRHEASKPENEQTREASAVDADENTEHVESAERLSEPDGKETPTGGDSANGVDEPEDTHIEGSRGAITTTDGIGAGDAEDSVMANTGATMDQRGAYSVANDALGQVMQDPKHSPSPERNIEPSMHPATCALYIKNFMRPLRPQTVRDHLLELATPANAPPDPNIIVNFYLDNIRTHAFAVFTSVSAASRVRTALHQRVWPDETNRKALWIDFIPSECFEDWVDTEQQTRDRGNMPRYEVFYGRDDDGIVTAKLEETDANQATRRGPVSPVVHPDRKLSIPTGPSRPSGIENAPTGPRNPYSHNGPPTMYSGRQDKLESGFIQTRSNPQILYQPVTTELAHRRLDCLAQAKDPRYDEESGRDYHRYYFERDDVLVNRGPEIFLGIRPPHREKERRELGRANTGTGAVGGGGDLRDRNYRDRRGPLGPHGGGGGGRRRRRAPRPHGVPRGGDRFRPGASYDDRSAPDNRHPPRREGYGGSNRRKDGHRY